MRASPITSPGRAGRDVLLVEKGELTSGSTCHAAGLVTQFNPSPTMMRFRRYSVELYRELGVFETVGSLRIASSPESLKELQRGGEPGARDRARRRASSRRRRPCACMPAATHGVPLRRGLDPGRRLRRPAHRHACARGCGPGARRAHPDRDAGDRDRARPGPRGARRPTRTDGRIETELRRERLRDLGAAGRRDGRARSRPRSPSTTSTSRSPRWTATSCRARCRASATPTTSSTGKAEAGGMLFGGYEPDPVARWVDGVPWEHGEPVASSGRRALRAAHGRARSGASRSWTTRAWSTLVCHPDAMTPDGNPLLGPMPGVPGFWMAAGLSLNGFGGAGGIGKTARRADHVRRDRARRPGLPGLALRRPVPRPRLRDRRRA